MFAKGKRLFLAMMQGLCQQQPMLVFCLGTNNDLLDLGTFFMGNTYDIFEVLLIEAFSAGIYSMSATGLISPTILSKATLNAL